MNDEWIVEMMAKIDEFEKLDRRDHAIDLVFRLVDKLLRDGEFAKCDRMLEVVDVKVLTTTMMIAFLSITRAASDKLQQRQGFLERVEVQLANDPTKDKLLLGLR